MSKPFDTQEAVVLLDVYLHTVEKGSTLKEAAKAASERLRALAKANQLIVSNDFRSPQGLMNRLRSLGAIYKGTESKSAPATAAFSEAVDLYQNDRQKFERILATEKGSNGLSAPQSSGKEDDSMADPVRKQKRTFIEWMFSVLSPSEAQELQKSFSMINTLLLKNRLLRQPLTSTKDPSEIEAAIRNTKKAFANKKIRSNATRLLSSYLNYLNLPEIDEEAFAATEEIDNADVHMDAPTEQTEGQNVIHFNFENSRDFERTRPVSCSVGGEKIEGRNWARILCALIEHELTAQNPNLNDLYKNSLLAEKKGRPFLMTEKIDGLNCSQLSNGYWMNVNYSIPRLMEIIAAFCLRCGYTKEDIVLVGQKRDSMPVREEKPSVVNAGAAVPIEKAEKYLHDIGIHGATIKELIAAVQPGASVYPTQSALETSDHLVAMPGDRYVHVDCFVDMEEAEEVLGSILKTHFAQFEGYSNNQLLFGAASQELFLFLNDNDCESVEAVYAIARYLFEKRALAGKPYKFSFPHIFETEPDYPMTLHGLMIHLARNNGGLLNAGDATSFLQKTKLTYAGLRTLLKIGKENTFLMYDSERYLLSEAISIDEGWCRMMHNRIDDLFRKANVAYVIPRDISTSWLSTLPLLPHGLGWTHLLLQDVLDKYPTIGFKSISPDLNQTHDTLAAAFVPDGSPLQTFPDVVTLFMEEKHQLPMRMAGEDLRQELRDAGMLENGEMIYALPKALDDYRFAWSDENKTVYVRGNK